jgi:hypothetical protein
MTNQQLNPSSRRRISNEGRNFCPVITKFWFSGGWFMVAGGGLKNPAVVV